MLSQSKFSIVVITAFLVAFILVVGRAEAIGLTPGRTTLDFEAGAEKEISFTIINNEHKEFNALVYVEGDMKNSVTIEKNIIEFKETDNSKDFRFKFRMPESMEKPGEYWTKIIVMEIPSEITPKKPEGQAVVATTAVVHQIKVKVPYPGKYVNIEVSVSEAEPGETATFFVKLFSLGTEKIYQASAIVDILGPTNEKIDSIESDIISIEPKTTGELIIPWKANVNPGLYQAVITVNYDGKAASVRKTFSIGTLRIEVLDIKVRNFVLGEIAKFEINVENKWNERVENVYAEMTITNQRGDVIGNFKSASIDVEPLQRATLYAYWDTQGVEKGTYDAKLVLHYANKTSEKMLKTIVGLESIETEIIGLTARAVTIKGGAGPGSDILVPLVLILIFINIGWFFYFRKKK